MAPLPQSNTARMWFDYEVGGIEHTVMVRYNQVLEDPEGPIAAMVNLLGWLEPALASNWVMLGARHAFAGSNISTPFDISATALAGFTGGNGLALDPKEHPRELVYVGRSATTGRRSRFSIYGGVFVTPANYRLGPGETAFAASEVFALLNAASFAGQAFVAIDNTRATWYPYVNVNYNSYWESERRTG